MCEQNDRTEFVPGNFNDTIAIQNTQVLCTRHPISLQREGGGHTGSRNTVRQAPGSHGKESQLPHSPRRKRPSPNPGEIIQQDGERV